MSKAARAAVAISVPAESSNQSDFNQLVPVALLSGIGLLVSLIVMLSGMQVAWY
jgi:Na+/H+ antiporter NhaA